MEFQYNGQTYNYPSTLEDITLGKRIAYHEQVGSEYDERFQELKEIEDEAERALEFADLQMDVACKTFAFFTGIPVEEAKERFDLPQVVNVFNVCLSVLLNEEKVLKLEDSYHFNNEEWFIQSPQLTPASEMTFNELLTSKEVTRQLNKLGHTKFEALQYLCCVFLRKKDEPFTEELAMRGGERWESFASLPLSIAFAVGFFLSSSIYTYNQISAFSSLEEEEAKEST